MPEPNQLSVAETLPYVAVFKAVGAHVKIYRVLPGRAIKTPRSGVHP